MVWSFVYLALRRVPEFGGAGWRSADARKVEILVLVTSWPSCAASTHALGSRRALLRSSARSRAVPSGTGGSSPCLPGAVDSTLAPGPPRVSEVAQRDSVGLRAPPREVVPIGSPSCSGERVGVGVALSPAPSSKERRCPTSPSSGEATDVSEQPPNRHAKRRWIPSRSPWSD